MRARQRQTSGGVDMASRKNKSLITQRNLSTPTYKTYHEERMAKNAPKPSQNLTPIEKNYFDLSEVKVANETQGRRVKKDTVLVQRTNGVVKRARRGFMVFLVMLFALLYVVVGALSFLQMEALDEYNSYLNMFTKVEEVVPEGATLEQIENGDAEYEYVYTNIGANDVIMSFAKMLMGDSIEGDYYFYNECLALIDGAETMNMIAYYALPVVLVLGIVIALIFFIRAFVSLCTSKRRKLFVLSSILMLVLSIIGIFAGFFWSGLEFADAMVYLNVMAPAAPLQVGYGYLIMTVLSLLALIASLFAFRSKKKVQ